MDVNQVPRSVKGCVHRCLGGACQCSTGIEWVFGNFGQREEHDSVRFPVRQPLGECTFGNPFSRLPAIVHDVSKMADQAWDLAGVIPCERSLGGIDHALKLLGPRGRCRLGGSCFEPQGSRESVWCGFEPAAIA